MSEDPKHIPHDPDWEHVTLDDGTVLSKPTGRSTPPDDFQGLIDILSREQKLVEAAVEEVQAIDSVPELRERRTALREQIGELENTLDGHMDTPLAELSTRLLKALRRKMNLKTHLKSVNRELQRRLDPAVMLHAGSVPEKTKDYAEAALPHLNGDTNVSGVCRAVASDLDIGKRTAHKWLCGKNPFYTGGDDQNERLENLQRAAQRAVHATA